MYEHTTAASGPFGNAITTRGCRFLPHVDNVDVDNVVGVGVVDVVDDDTDVGGGVGIVDVVDDDTDVGIVVVVVVVVDVVVATMAESMSARSGCKDTPIIEQPQQYNHTQLTSTEAAKNPFETVYDLIPENVQWDHIDSIYCVSTQCDMFVQIDLN